jgi:hypothetical protein
MFITSGVEKYSRQRPTLPCTYAHSTIGGGRLNFRVRNGNGCDPAPMATGKLVANRHQPACQTVVRGPVARSAALGRPRRATRSSRTILSGPTSRRPASKNKGQLNILQTVVPIVLHTRICVKNYGQASRLISTSQLNASLRFHIWPINLVVYQEPSEALRPGRSHLVEGFTLRCLQRFSLPDVATRRCRWRDNRYTRGPSNPVLSY